mgnify:CR=1 FL=1
MAIPGGQDYDVAGKGTWADYSGSEPEDEKEWIHGQRPDNNKKVRLSNLIVIQYFFIKNLKISSQW